MEREGGKEGRKEATHAFVTQGGKVVWSAGHACPPARPGLHAVGAWCGSVDHGGEDDRYEHNCAGQTAEDEDGEILEHRLFVLIISNLEPLFLFLPCWNSPIYEQGFPNATTYVLDGEPRDNDEHVNDQDCGRASDDGL